ncbi:hypothetical protein [Maricaulis sp.]|uniref:hypothetical protein n=1 Tax=Maricaulis sp. TaxID=1486257 RepID=UPI003A8CC68D
MITTFRNVTARYALTDRRLILVRGLLFKQVRSLGEGSITDISRLAGLGGSSLLINQTSSPFGIRDPAQALIGLADAQAVEARLLDRYMRIPAVRKNRPA